MQKIGRPTAYSEELADEICDVISESNRGLPTLCKRHLSWPTYSTLRRWISQIDDFRDKYIKAKESQADYLADEMLEIADDTTYDTIENENGKEVCNNEFVNRSRLRVDTRKFIVKVLAPRQYSEQALLVMDMQEKVRKLELLVEQAQQKNGEQYVSSNSSQL